MSRQLAISSAISIMIMAVFVLYGPDWVPKLGNGQQRVLQLPEFSGLKALVAN